MRVQLGAKAFGGGRASRARKSIDLYEISIVIRLVEMADHKALKRRVRPKERQSVG
jgi:hypothetical protein